MEKQEEEIIKCHLENITFQVECKQLQEEADRNIIGDIVERVNNQLEEHFDSVISPVVKSINENLDLNSKQIGVVKTELDEFIQ